jgi:hypothetical protein
MANVEDPDIWRLKSHGRDLPRGLGAGCGPYVVGLIFIIVVVCAVVYCLHRDHQRSLMKVDLASLRLSEWEQSTARFRVESHHFGGRRLYRLKIDPAQAQAFVRSAGGTLPEMGPWTNEIGTDAPAWWTPKDEAELWITRVDPTSWSGWVIAASPKSGDAFIERARG